MPVKLSFTTAGRPPIAVSIPVESSRRGKNPGAAASCSSALLRRSTGASQTIEAPRKPLSVRHASRAAPRFASIAGSP